MSNARGSQQNLVYNLPEVFDQGLVDVGSSRVVDVGPLVLVQVQRKYLLSWPGLKQYKRGSGHAVDKIYRINVSVGNGSEYAKDFGLA
jgi:hypothetical protein